MEPTVSETLRAAANGWPDVLLKLHVHLRVLGFPKRVVLTQIDRDELVRRNGVNTAQLEWGGVVVEVGEEFIYEPKRVVSREIRRLSNEDSQA
jgi:hypothetical protein